jgi:hypothetical protein
MENVFRGSWDAADYTGVSPLRLDQLSKWLDKVLVSSMTDVEQQAARIGGSTPSQYFCVDRESLQKTHHLDKKCIDRVYRSLFVYSSGIHQVIRECSRAASRTSAKELRDVSFVVTEASATECSEEDEQRERQKNLAYVIWRAFVRVLENCDATNTQLILSAHETEQGQYLLNIIDKYKAQLSNTTGQSQYFHDMYKKTESALHDTEKSLQVLNKEYAECQQRTDSQLQTLTQSFSDEHTARVTAERTFNNLTQQIAELTQSNKYLNEKCTILREGMHTSMDESYRYQESSKQYFHNASELAELLRVPETARTELSEWLDNEFKQRMELMDKHAVMAEMLSSTQNERDTLTKDIVNVGKMYRCVSDCLCACVQIAPKVLTYVGKNEMNKPHTVLSGFVFCRYYGTVEKLGLFCGRPRIRRSRPLLGRGASCSPPKFPIEQGDARVFWYWGNELYT